MRVLCAALGTRGDIEPFALVARELAARGHEVELGLDPGHHAPAAAVAGTRVGLRELGRLSAANLREIVGDAYGRATADERTTRAFERLFLERRDALSERIAHWDREHFDLFVLPPCLLFPLVFRRSPAAPLEYGMRWSTRTVAMLQLLAADRDYEQIGALDCLRLALVSPRFAPPTVTGWQFIGFGIDPRARSLGDRLESFLAAGTPPIVLTTGSGVGFGPRLVDAVIGAARRHGVRAIVRRGWSELAGGPGDDVLTIDDTDYASLFPRCAAVIALGGIGTVAQALHAGRPLIVLAAVHDQIALAHALHARRACVGAVDPYTVSEHDLGRLVERALRDPRAQVTATAVADELRHETGVATACDAIAAYHHLRR
jgi:UDP:flavonoid glycosyltransferase YjiC (YdhE family)